MIWNSLRYALLICGCTILPIVASYALGFEWSVLFVFVQLELGNQLVRQQDYNQ